MRALSLEEILAKWTKRTPEGCLVWRGYTNSMDNGAQPRVSGTMAKAKFPDCQCRGTTPVSVRHWVVAERIGRWPMWVNVMCDTPGCVEHVEEALMKPEAQGVPEARREEALRLWQEGQEKWEAFRQEFKAKYTFQAIGNKLGVTRERARQLVRANKEPNIPERPSEFKARGRFKARGLRGRKEHG